MKTTILVDNAEKAGLSGEWGFSAYIEYDTQKILLDTGASELFLKNARKLGCPIREVNLAVLSHAHYDHGNGMEAFFRENQTAPFCLQAACAEDCYFKKWCFRKYIGLPKGVLVQYASRITRVSAVYPLAKGVTLVPHTTKGLEAIGRREQMYRKTPQGWLPDDFSHEQSLVFETAAGLVIFNSCSHGGVVNSIREVQQALPGKPIRAMIGGFHLLKRSETEIRALAHLIRETGIEKIYTGHCSKERGYRILREELGETVGLFHTGLVLTF